MKQPKKMPKKNVSGTLLYMKGVKREVKREVKEGVKRGK